MFEISCLRRETPKSFTFVFPNVEDISDIAFGDIVGKLANPTQLGTARASRHMIFKVDLKSYAATLR